MPTGIHRSRLRDHFRALLQLNHLRVTPERLIVFDEICSLQTHFDADDILVRLKQRHAAISRATVYRTIELLEKYGVIRRSKLTGVKSHFELTLERRHHEHMICTSCGKVIEFESKGIESIQQVICREYHFTMTYHYLHIFGICDDCAKR